jgi:stage II sporulation protein R
VAVGATEQTVEEESFQIIPDEAIRLRILANSDQEVDQQVKRLVRDEVSEQISGWVEDLDDIEQARQLIQSRIPEITETVRQVVAASGEKSVHVEYGEEITFPTKLYDSYIYPAGEYEAVLITIGDGEGANWWCVLFPPLCFLDFSSGTVVADGDIETEEETEEIVDEEEVKIKFFLFEWFGWT